MKRLLLAASVTTLLSACAGMGHVDYECALAEVEAAKCASMEDAYKLSKTVKRNGKVQSVFEGQGSSKAKDKDGQAADANAQQQQRPFFRSEQSNYPDAAQQGMPVFQQPKVMRVWVAPYVDADGNLRSGEYTYFATPGAWNYGTLHKPGAASDMFEPTKPGQLGFNPREVGKSGPTAASPSKPPEVTSGSSGGAKPPIPASSSGPQNQGGITQPYQRLSN